MSGFFTVGGVGNVTKEIEVKDVGSTQLAEFSVAYNRGIKKGDDWDNVPTYLEVKAWGKLAEFAGKLSKGEEVQFAGNLEQEWWVKDNEKRSKYVCNLSSLRSLAKKEKSEEVKGEVPF